MASKSASRVRDVAVNGVIGNIYTGGRTMQQVATTQQCPEDVGESIELSHKWQREHWFIGQALDARCAFYNYGLKIQPQSAKKSDRKTLKEWLDAGARPQRGSVQTFIRRTIEEFETVDNTVARWNNYGAPGFRGSDLEGQGVKPAYLYLPEKCEFTDKFGIEVLKVKPDMTVEEMRDRKFPPALINRYSSGLVTLDPIKWGENFKVLRRSAFEGFATPQLNWVFKTLKQCESMEVGEQALGMLARSVIRLWKQGFEPKVAPLAQGQIGKWGYDDKVAKAWEKWVRGVIGGLAQATVRFDRKFEDVWVDPKLFDGKKWDTIVNRLLWWSGPVGFMFISKSVSPFLLGMLRTQAERDRGIFGPFLEEVINASFKPPVPIRLRWSNECFNDSRLAWDMTKTLIQTGAASLTTGLEKAGLEPELEGENKEMEAKPENVNKFTPLLLKVNEAAIKGRPGRKSGVADNSSTEVAL